MIKNSRLFEYLEIEKSLKGFQLPKNVSDLRVHLIIKLLMLKLGP